jgi:catechol 2,3-dioxygenase
MAIFVHDIDKMVDFYTRVMGLIVSDRGKSKAAETQLAFMSSDPGEHHQFVLATGRPDYATFSIAQQISFLVDSLEEVCLMYQRLLGEDEVKIDRTTTHGNAWSVYFFDPEGNRIEIYTHTPWHVPQPHSHPIDLTLSVEEIRKITEAHCRADPGFMIVEEREKEMARRLELVD